MDCPKDNVCSLFNNVPLNDTIDHLCTLIDFNKFPVNKPTLKNLLTLACKNILFQFQNLLYLQTDGVAMDSSLGPMLASFAMNLVETQIPNMPLYYRRYVDDVFALFPNEETALDFLFILNSIHDNIQFTLETERNRQLKFLDVIVTREDNNFKTVWSFKDTNTGVYINKCAIAPLKYKRAAIRSLIIRAKHPSGTSNAYDNAYLVICNVFVREGYHNNFIDKIKDEVDSKPKLQISQNTSTTN